MMTTSRAQARELHQLKAELEGSPLAEVPSTAQGEDEDEDEGKRNGEDKGRGRGRGKGKAGAGTGKKDE